MKINTKEVINKSLAEVYGLVKNDIEKIVPYLPNVDQIKVVSKEELDGKLKLENHWFAKAELPSLLKKFIKPEILSWKDLATWDDSTHSVSYEMESFLANDLFDAKGTNTFRAIDENTTELTLECEVIIYPEKVPGVPRLLAGKAKPLIEGLIEKILTPNLTSLGKGINEYYSKN